MFSSLILLLKSHFDGIVDKRRVNKHYSLSDSLLCAFAMFSLKDPSLHLFRTRYDQREANLKRIFLVENPPGDSALRESIDQIDSTDLQSLFPSIFKEIESEGLLESRQVLGGYLPLSVDGTGHFCSSKVSCPNCLEKKKKNGEIQYYHQMLAAVQVHPESSAVFPFGVESITKQDGQTKNDCEQNAFKRLLPRLSKEYCEHKLLFILDGLYATGPVIQQLRSKQAGFIIGTKSTYVNLTVERLKDKDELSVIRWSDGKTQGIARFTNKLILNGSHPDIEVNYFEFERINLKSGKRTFFNSWITDLDLSWTNIKEIVAVARSRWKVENETFNTLKNQGYHFEHNYGHGKKALSTNLAILMFLAFLIDQICQILCAPFIAAWQVAKTKQNLWEKLRQIFDLMGAKSLEAIYKFIAEKRQIDFPLLE